LPSRVREEAASNKATEACRSDYRTEASDAGQIIIRSLICGTIQELLSQGYFTRLLSRMPSFYIPSFLEARTRPEMAIFNLSIRPIVGQEDTAWLRKIAYDTRCKLTNKRTGGNSIGTGDGYSLDDDDNKSDEARSQPGAREQRA
jgi:hypothetical protein